MSPATAARAHRLARSDHRTVPARADRLAAARLWREDVLAAVAEGQSVEPAGVTNALLAKLTPDLAIGERAAAVVALRDDGLLTRFGLHLRLTAAGRDACRVQWAGLTGLDAPVVRAHRRTGAGATTSIRRTLTRADAEAMVDEFTVLNERAPDLAQEVGGGFVRQWAAVERALAHGVVALDERMAVQVACMADGIRDRLADLAAAA